MSAANVERRNGYAIVTMGDTRVEVWDARESWQGWADAYVSLASHRLEDAQACFDLRACLEAAEELLEEFNAAAAERKAKLQREREEAEKRREREMAEYRERQRKEREERQAALEARAAQMAERKELLMHEFVDEPVKARARGYKQAVRAHVRVRELTRWEGMNRVGTGEFQVYIEYVYDNDYNRPNRIEDIWRLEVKPEGSSRYKVLWDDGRTDLGYDKGADAEKEHKMENYDMKREEW